MKNISLKLEETDKFDIGDDTPDEVVKKILKNSILIFQQQYKGLNISQQRQAIKILDAIEEAELLTITLEDSEYKFFN